MKCGLVFSAVLVVLLSTPFANAIQLYMDAGLNYDGAGGAGFVAYYNSRQAGVGDAVNNCYRCFICHTGVPQSAGNLNVYATDWKAAWIAIEPGRATNTDENPNANAVKAFQNIETGPVASGSSTGDSDMDGSSNQSEIFGAMPSNPGNKLSTPSSPGTCPTGFGVGGGGNQTLGSSGAPAYNLNALNSKCGFQGSGAGMIKVQDDPLRIFTELLFFLFPVMVFSLLKIQVRNPAPSYRRKS